MAANQRTELTHAKFYNSPLVIAVIIAVIGALLAVYEDHLKRQDETRVGYLIEAYDDLALAANREPGVENNKRIETAIAKIQLFGTTEEIKLVYAFLDEWMQTAQSGRPKASVDALLKTLRNRLRSELSLAPVPRELENVRWLRVQGGAQ